MLKLNVDRCEREHDEKDKILDEKDKILDFNLVNRCVCEHRRVAYSVNAKKHYERVYTNFSFEKKKRIYLYNNTLTTFTIAYVPDAYATAINTIKLETPLVRMSRKIATLRCGEYVVIKKKKENKYSKLVDKISEGEYEEREKKNNDDETFYYISINEFVTQKDDREVVRILEQKLF
jgi:hypothetical protein